MPNKEASDGGGPERRLRAAGAEPETREAQPAEQHGEMEVFGDQTTNMIMLGLVVLAWLFLGPRLGCVLLGDQGKKTEPSNKPYWEQDPVAAIFGSRKSPGRGPAATNSSNRIPN